MSSRVRCLQGSNEVTVGTVNSAHQRKPKKPIQAATHSIRQSGDIGWVLQARLSCDKIAGVIGKRDLRASFKYTLEHLMPLITSSTL